MCDRSSDQVKYNICQNNSPGVEVAYIAPTNGNLFKN